MPVGKLSLSADGNVPGAVRGDRRCLPGAKYLKIKVYSLERRGEGRAQSPGFFSHLKEWHKIDAATEESFVI